ncbi:FtsK/SpoIIIE domain-containing protein [Pseudarthrobacter sulfonivorans]|uniref:FtsK/SpoIIIE domain-containing protein n=1 Tax=Pseudarthrobacter sulfonivorans TaxID=121292 RepID=UPI0021057890|nr:FtsK/SpoIIIE domain-containing protein [Pseudarthrobacter sulfonivorans]
MSIDGQDLTSLTLGQPPLINGATLVDAARIADRRSRQRTPEPPASLALAVHSGAGAGLVVPLRRGTYTIGRSNADIIIPDADLSRVHARLVVTETAIMIEDLASSNGTEVDGERQRNAVVTTASTIACGNSTMSLAFLNQPPGQLDLAGLNVHEPLVIRRHDYPSNRTALLLAAVLPLIIGVGLAVITGMWMFLAFTAVSAISILVPAIGGRRQRKELAAALSAAVATDQERRRRAAPPLSALTLGDASDRNRVSPDADTGIWLRLGQGAQPANLRFDPPAPGRPVPSGGILPVTLDPARPLTIISGPRDLAEGLVRSLLMQLAGYPLGRETHVVVHGKNGQLPLAARFLPGVTLSGHAATAHTLVEHGITPSHGHGVLILLDDAENAPAIIEEAREHGWQTINFPGDSQTALPADIELEERTSVLRTGTETIRFQPDLAPAEVFEEFCRRLAGDTSEPGTTCGNVPPICQLVDLLPASAPDIARQWATNTSKPGLAVPVGLNAETVQTLDLQSDGPHLLIAGTTGSGKSELLRTLTIALATSYPPDRISFLFVDFKGGSGLGPLTRLPHCAGMLTDLSSHELERHLQSLRAEIRFREEIMASVEAPDLTAYRATAAGLTSPLPHLVIIIDEFRMLVEDAPESLRELMRIAAIGRSLGIHLIMATQRPQGALTADIRANVTTSICLRVQSEMESLDIINSTAAAGISIDTPGRAYLVRGTQSPVEFQAASLTAGDEASEPTRLSVHLATDYIHDPPAGGEPDAAAASPTPAQATTPLIASLAKLWEAMNGAPVRKPVAPSLPRVLTEPPAEAVRCPGNATGSTNDDAEPAQHLMERDSEAPADHHWTVRLGVMDLPSEQRTAPLIWEPGRHGHMGFVGGPEAGVADATRLAVLRLASHRHESHLYILDPDGSFASLDTHGRVGARAGLHEIRRAVRVLERLAQEQSRRLAGPLIDVTPLALVIAGWGSWTSAFRSGPLAWAEDLVHDLIRDGAKARISVIISGQRELVTSRFFAAIPNRVYFPTGSTEENRIAWPNLPTTAPVTGRGVATGALSGGTTAVCQFYSAGPDSAGPDSGEVSSGHTLTTPATIRPFRVEPLPVMLPAAHLLAKSQPLTLNGTPADTPDEATARARQTPGLLRIGVGGDELETVSIRVPPGGVLAVLGGPSSGKSSLLRLLPHINPDASPWLRPDPGSEPTAYWAEVLNQASAGVLDKRSVALVDDADLLPFDVNRQLAEIHALGIAVIITAGFNPSLAQRVPLAFQARNLGTGVLIAPRSFLDGDLFGVRFEVQSNPPPGRCVVIQNGHAMPVQLGWVPPDEEDSPGLTAPEASRRSGRRS